MELLLFFRCHFVHFFIHGFGRLKLLLNPVKSRGQADGQRQIGIGSRIWRAQLDLCLAASRRRYSDQRAFNPCGPGLLNRRLISGDQPLIGINQRVGDSAHPLDVGQQTADKIICFIRKL